MINLGKYLPYYFAPVGSTPAGLQVLRSACLNVCLYILFVPLLIRLFVCLSALISQKPHVQISRNFLYILPLAVVRSSYDDSAIRYVILVLRVTLYFHVPGPMEQNQRQRYVSSSSTGGGTSRLPSSSVVVCRL